MPPPNGRLTGDEFTQSGSDYFGAGSPSSGAERTTVPTGAEDGILVDIQNSAVGNPTRPEADQPRLPDYLHSRQTPADVLTATPNRFQESTPSDAIASLEQLGEYPARSAPDSLSEALEDSTAAPQSECKTRTGRISPPLTAHVEKNLNRSRSSTASSITNEVTSRSTQSLPPLHSDKGAPARSSSGLSRSVTFSQSVKSDSMDDRNPNASSPNNGGGSSSIPSSFWRDSSYRRSIGRRLSSGYRGDSISPSGSRASPATIGILRVHHEDSDGETREVELEVDIDASSSSADETTAFVGSSSRSGRDRNYGGTHTTSNVPNAIAEDSEEEVGATDGSADEGRKKSRKPSSANSGKRRPQLGPSRSDGDSAIAGGRGASSGVSNVIRSSSLGPGGLEGVRASIKRSKRNSQQRIERSPEPPQIKEPFYKRIADKYGSIELENKGAVARDHLALERTFLAWLRTSLSFASIGIAITQLFRLNTTISRSEPLPDQLRLRHIGKPLGATFIAISIVILLIGFHRYFESQHFVVRGKFPASRGSIIAVSTVTGALIAASFVIVLIINPAAAGGGS